MNKKEHHIRQLAYDIWQSEGCPEGQDARHWEMACKLVEAQGGTGTPTVKPAGKTRKTANKPVDATPDGKSAKRGSGQNAKSATAATAPDANAQPGPAAATDAQAGTPENIKKTRSTRSAKNS